MLRFFLFFLVFFQLSSCNNAKEVKTDTTITSTSPSVKKRTKLGSFQNENKGNDFITITSSITKDTTFLKSYFYGHNVTKVAVAFLDGTKNTFQLKSERNANAPVYTYNKEEDQLSVRRYNGMKDKFESSIYNRTKKRNVKKHADQVSKNFISHLYKKKNFDVLTKDQKRFRFAEIDLNDDNEYEYILSVLNSDFCGSGGCSFWVLSRDGKIISKTTVADFPIYVSTNKMNDWSDLIVPSNKKLHQVSYEKGKGYTSNASNGQMVNKPIEDIDIQCILLAK